MSYLTHSLIGVLWCCDGNRRIGQITCVDENIVYANLKHVSCRAIKQKLGDIRPIYADSDTNEQSQGGN